MLPGCIISPTNPTFAGPLTAIFGGYKAPLTGRRRLIVIDGLDEVSRDEWGDLKAFLQAYTRDMSPMVCILATVRTDVFSFLMPRNDDCIEGRPRSVCSLTVT